MIDVPVDDLRLMLEAGYLYLAMRRIKEAREVFEGVALLAPNSDVPRVALGNVFFNEGKYSEAIKSYLKTVEEFPESAFAVAYLGEAYLFGNQPDKAKESLTKASHLDPNGKSGDFARSLLDLMKKGFNPSNIQPAPQKA